MAYFDKDNRRDRYISGGEHLDEMMGAIGPDSPTEQMLLAGGYDPMQTEFMSRGQDIQKTAGQGGIYGQKYGPVTGQWAEGEQFGGGSPFRGIAGGTGGMSGFGRGGGPGGGGFDPTGALKIGAKGLERYASRQVGGRSVGFDGSTVEANIRGGLPQGGEKIYQYEQGGDRLSGRKLPSGGIEGQSSLAALGARQSALEAAGYSSHEAFRIASNEAATQSGFQGIGGIGAGAAGAAVGYGAGMGMEALTGNVPGSQVFGAGVGGAVAGGLGGFAGIAPGLAAAGPAGMLAMGVAGLGVALYDKFGGPKKGYMDYRNIARNAFARETEADLDYIGQGVSGHPGFGAGQQQTGARQYWMKDMMDQGYSYEDVRDTAAHYHQDEFYQGEAAQPTKGVPWTDPEATAEGFRSKYGTGMTSRMTDPNEMMTKYRSYTTDQGDYSEPYQVRTGISIPDVQYKPAYEGQQAAPWLQDYRWGPYSGSRWGNIGGSYGIQWEAAQKAGKNPYEMEALGDRLAAGLAAQRQQEEEGGG